MIGLDYSVKPNMMILGDCEFPQLITDAIIAGLGYISIPLNPNDSTKLKVAFIFKDSIKGNKVMDRFLSWINSSNGNMKAFGLDVIEKNDGSYLLCFYQEQDLLLERLISREIREWINPLLSVVVHYKCIDSRSEQYYMFKKACEFSKCHIYGADTTGRILSFNKVIIKENIRFYKEDDITEDSFLYSFKSGNSFLINKKYRTNLDNITEVTNFDRIYNIKYFFPITYNAIINCEYFNNILEELEGQFDKSIIIQAICNIVLEYRISQDKIELNKNSVIDWIQYLVNNYETPKSKFPNDDNYAIKDILEQIKKDEEYFIEAKGGN